MSRKCPVCGWEYTRSEMLTVTGVTMNLGEKTCVDPNGTKAVTTVYFH